MESGRNCQNHANFWQNNRTLRWTDHAKGPMSARFFGNWISRLSKKFHLSTARVPSILSEVTIAIHTLLQGFSPGLGRGEPDLEHDSLAD
jgi:hypothetical protein